MEQPAYREINDDHMLVLGVLRHRPLARPDEIAEVLDMSAEVVVRLCADLVAAGWIEPMVQH